MAETKQPQQLSYDDLIRGLEKEDQGSPQPFRVSPIGEVVDQFERLQLADVELETGGDGDEDSHVEACDVEGCTGIMEKYTSEFSLECGTCGRSKAVGNIGEHNISTGDDHNISSNAYMYFRATGGNRIYSNAMVKYTSEHTVHRENDIRQRFREMNYRNHNPIPQNVINEAADMFITLKSEDYVRRGRNLKGVEGACVYMKCREFGITKSKAEIAGYYRIDESLISFGCSELKTFESRGIIELPQNKDPTIDYVNAIFEIFDIPDRYHKFVTSVLERIESKGIIKIKNCFTTTKVVGVVYLLSQLEGLGIDHSSIEAKYRHIGHTTYNNVVKAIIANPTKMIKPFEQYGITRPSEWRDIIIKPKS